MSVPYVVLTGIFLLSLGSKYLVVSWAPLLVGDTAEKLYYFNLHQVVQSLILHNYKGSGRGRLGAPRPPWRVRVECEEVFVLELSGTHELHTINTTYQVADVRPSGLR